MYNVSSLNFKTTGEKIMSTQEIKLRARQVRETAWGNLSGKWGTFAVIYLLYALIVGASGMIPIATLIIAGPMVIGISIAALKVTRQADIEVNDTFAGFKNFGTNCVIYILNNLFIALWTLLFFVPGIVKTYAYSMSYFIIADHPEMSATEARKESIRMMKGNKWRLFCLEFSFIGWMLLTSLTCGILSFWVMPYMTSARAVFYEDLKAKEAPAVEDAPAEEATDAPADEAAE